MIEQKDGRICVSGAVTLENALALREQMAKYLGGSQCVIDFAGVTEIDSAAVGLMLDWLRLGRAAGTRVQFTGLGDAVSSLVDLYGVGDLLPASSA